MLHNRYREDINDRLKLAIAVGMLPKEYQDVVLQAFGGMEKCTYEQMRDHVINLAHQRAQMKRATPLSVDQVGGDYGGEGDCWEAQCWPCEDESWLEAIDKSNVQCYYCGKTGHIARDCFQKGKGKGASKSGKGGFKGAGKSGGGENLAKGAFGKSGKGKGFGKKGMSEKGYGNAYWNPHPQG